MQKYATMASVAALAIMTAACGGGDSEPAAPAEEAAPAAPVADAAPAAEEPVAAADPGDPMATTDGVAFASLTGDAAAGKVVFAQCRSCHTTEAGVNKTGPSLAGVVGRPAGSIEDFDYSPANANSGITWTPEQLYVYLENPQRVVPKTKMIYPGLTDAQKRADIIAYLQNPT